MPNMDEERVSLCSNPAPHTYDPSVSSRPIEVSQTLRASYVTVAKEDEANRVDQRQEVKTLMWTFFVGFLVLLAAGALVSGGGTMRDLKASLSITTVLLTLSILIHVGVLVYMMLCAKLETGSGEMADERNAIKAKTIPNRSYPIVDLRKIPFEPPYSATRFFGEVTLKSSLRLPALVPCVLLLATLYVDFANVYLAAFPTVTLCTLSPVGKILDQAPGPNCTANVMFVVTHSLRSVHDILSPIALVCAYLAFTNILTRYALLKRAEDSGALSGAAGRCLSAAVYMVYLNFALSCYFFLDDLLSAFVPQLIWMPVDRFFTFASLAYRLSLCLWIMFFTTHDLASVVNLARRTEQVKDRLFDTHTRVVLRDQLSYTYHFIKDRSQYLVLTLAVILSIGFTGGSIATTVVDILQAKSLLEINGYPLLLLQLSIVFVLVGSLVLDQYWGSAHLNRRDPDSPQLPFDRNVCCWALPRGFRTNSAMRLAFAFGLGFLVLMITLAQAVQYHNETNIPFTSALYITNFVTIVEYMLYIALARPQHARKRGMMLVPVTILLLQKIFWIVFIVSVPVHFDALLDRTPNMAIDLFFINTCAIGYCTVMIVYWGALLNKYWVDWRRAIVLDSLAAPS